MLLRRVRRQPPLLSVAVATEDEIRRRVDCDAVGESLSVGRPQRVAGPVGRRQTRARSRCGIDEPHRRQALRIASIDGEAVEVKLRNISAMGALVECPVAVSPGTELAIDIVGVAPVRGCVRWAQAGKFGIQFGSEFDLSYLAPKKVKRNDVTMLRPWYVEAEREAG